MRTFLEIILVLLFIGAAVTNCNGRTQQKPTAVNKVTKVQPKQECIDCAHELEDLKNQLSNCQEQLDITIKEIESEELYQRVEESLKVHDGAH